MYIMTFNFRTKKTFVGSSICNLSGMEVPLIITKLILNTIYFTDIKYYLKLFKTRHDNE